MGEKEEEISGGGSSPPKGTAMQRAEAFPSLDLQEESAGWRHQRCILEICRAWWLLHGRQTSGDLSQGEGTSWEDGREARGNVFFRLKKEKASELSLGNERGMFGGGREELGVGEEAKKASLDGDLCPILHMCPGQ